MRKCRRKIRQVRTMRIILDPARSAYREEISRHTNAFLGFLGTIRPYSRCCDDKSILTPFATTPANLVDFRRDAPRDKHTPKAGIDRSRCPRRLAARQRRIRRIVEDGATSGASHRLVCGGRSPLVASLQQPAKIRQPGPPFGFTTRKIVDYDLTVPAWDGLSLSSFEAASLRPLLFHPAAHGDHSATTRLRCRIVKRARGRLLP
jgi:hypothetical protein